MRFNYINEYDWANGVFQGKIPTYALVTMAGGYQLKRGISLRMVVTNLLNDEHYEGNRMPLVLFGFSYKL